MSRRILAAALCLAAVRNTQVVIALLGLAALARVPVCSASPQVLWPSLYSPADNSIVATTTPTFTWSWVVGADYYQLQVLSSFGSVRYDSAIDHGPILDPFFSPRFTLPAGYLSNGGTYRWKVRAFDGGDPSLLWSQEWTFQVDLPTTGIPAVPIQVSPLSGATVTTTAPTLSWQPALGAVAYKVYVYPLVTADLLYGGDLIFGTSVQIPANVLEHGSTYRWFARSVNTAGSSGFSELWVFTIDAPPNVAPSISLPLDFVAITLPDTTLRIPLVIDDPDDYGWSYFLSQSPSSGSLTIENGFDGVIYTPVSGFEGIDTFSVYITDSANAVSNVLDLQVRVGPPEMSFLPTQGPVGTSVTIVGSYFGPSENVEVFLADASVGLQQTVGGMFSTDFTIPVTSGGTKQIRAVGADTGATQSAPFTVVPAITSISESLFDLGETVTITGNGAGAGDTLQVMLATAENDSPLEDAVADTSASVTITGGGSAQASGIFQLTFQVNNRIFDQARTQVRLKVVSVHTGVESDWFGKDADISGGLEVVTKGVRLSLNQTSGAGDASLTVTGFAADDSGNARLNANIGSVTLQHQFVSSGARVVVPSTDLTVTTGLKEGDTVRTDSAGKFEVSFPIGTATEPKPGGLLTVSISGESVYYTITPQLRVVGADGAVTSQLELDNTYTLEGVGFFPQQTIAVTFDGSALDTSSVTKTDAFGRFTTTFDVAQPTLGGLHSLSGAGPFSATSTTLAVVGTITNPADVLLPVIRGDVVGVSGIGFGANEELTFSVGPTTIPVAEVSDGTSAADGTFASRITIPAIRAGAHDLVVSSASSGAILTDAFMVIDPNRPMIEMRNTWLFDPAPGGNGDGVASRRERLQPRARMKNEGGGDAANVRVVLTIADTDVTVVNGTVTHATWPAGAARNNVGFVLDIAPDATAHDVTVIVDVTADNGGPWQFTYTFPIVRPAYEFTQRSAWLFDPAPRGNRDGVANPGERVYPRVRLRNDGPGDAANVRVTVTTADPDVTTVNGEVTHATWPEGAARNNEGFILDIAPAATSHDVTLAVEVTSDGGGLWQFQFVFPIVAPALEMTKRRAWVYEPTASTRNGHADPGERVLPRLRLVNEGPTDAVNVAVTLTVNDPDVTVVNGVVSHATWPAGAARNNDGLILDILPNATSHQVSATVDVTADNGGPWQFTFSFPVVASALTFAKRNAWVFEPAAATRNGHADPGERVLPRVRLVNEGPTDAVNVAVTLTVNDPDVTVVNGVVSHATWPAGAARNNDGLVLDISPNATSHQVSATVDVTADDGGPWQFTFGFPVVASGAVFAKRNAWIYDPTPRADKDGVAEPGERVRPRFRLKNEGQADAANVVATLTVADADVTVVRAEDTHATWPAGAARTIVGFVIEIAPDATSHEVTAVVDVTADGAGPWQFTFAFPIVPGPPEFALRSSWVYDPAPEGNRDGVANPDERVLPRVRLKNEGQTGAENVVVTVSTGDANAAVAAATVTHATWPAGVARNNDGFAVDIGVAASGTIAFTVDVTADNGGPWQFAFTVPVSASAAPRALRPLVSTLLSNYPNPFNPETWIPFDLGETADVSVGIYDMRGREIRRIDLGLLDAGTYRGRSRAAYWDGRNDLGERAASGVYVYELRAGEFVRRRRMVIRK